MKRFHKVDTMLGIQFPKFDISKLNHGTKQWILFIEAIEILFMWGFFLRWKNGIWCCKQKKCKKKYIFSILVKNITHENLFIPRSIYILQLFRNSRSIYFFHFLTHSILPCWYLVDLEEHHLYCAFVVFDLGCC